MVYTDVLTSEPGSRPLPITLRASGTVVSAPKRVRATPAALRWSLFSRVESKSPIPAPSATLVPAISRISRYGQLLFKHCFYRLPAQHRGRMDLYPGLETSGANLLSPSLRSGWSLKNRRRRRKPKAKKLKATLQKPASAAPRDSRAAWQTPSQARRAASLPARPSRCATSARRARRWFASR